MPHIAPEPLLHSVALDALRPTQMTVGLAEVARKREEWSGRDDADRPDFLGRHMIPVVVGPKGRRWMVDHHHLARALHDEGVLHILVSVVADLSHLKADAFMTYMDNRNWLHPFDDTGHRQDYKAIPKHIGKLTDDPYRSLAGQLRRMGGYAKVDILYAEFLWASFLRDRIKASRLRDDFDGCVDKALVLARSAHAAHLPGWAGRAD
ncbi:ParB-like protein [Novosphingobium resinovorum]|uniref:ParB-like protein n=1 Tax=Novosphingobium TaxID=165696 RepID=UPI001B3C4CDA|nr:MULTISPECIES: ParB-like protein [Novosphingobium]MBF7013731.1 chromosome partitioning protein ParB [Novosphingobium sp. HR1a]WJM25874.1 ParB-like protein [Novosphingobium resinovorum]